MKICVKLNLRRQFRACGIVLAACLAFSTVATAQISLWTDFPSKAGVSKSAAPQRGDQSKTSRQVTLNLNAMIEHLAQAPRKVARGRAGPGGAEFQVDLPHPDGGFEAFTVYATTVMSPELAAKFPDIRTFSGVSMRDPTVKLRLDHTTAGLHAQVLGPGTRWHIDPLSSTTTTQYRSYQAKGAMRSGRGFQCLVEGQADVAASTREPGYQQKTQARPSGETLRTYRLAIAATGEYGQFHGGTTESAFGAIVTTINRVDGIFQQELAIALTLVGDNNLIVYTNPGTDPFTGNGNAGVLIDESQSVIDSVIGSGNYDIGHTFSTGAGGLAKLGVICNNALKAKGVTGSSSPQSDPFDVSYVAHEIGHQFGGQHTFNGSNNSCSGGNRNASTAFEPGSGSTIQAYAGICGADDLQTGSDAIFHSVSFDEMIAHVTEQSGASCDAPTATGNTIPSVDAGTDFTIPHSTPFMLTGSASDANGDTLTYLWEQRDLGNQSPLAALDDGAIPLFRVLTPTTSPSRFLPQLSTLASGLTSTSEKLPNQARAMNWRLTVRDNRSGGGGVNSDNMVVNVDGRNGPFAVLSPNGGETVSGNVAVTWDVAGTNGAPVNATQVDFFLSTDSGQSFDLDTPLGVTVNDGSATVSFPGALSSSTVRLMIKAQGNIFFDISDLDFTVAAVASPPGEPTITSAQPGNGSATFAFTPGAEGASPTTSFTASCAANSMESASGNASPGLELDGSSVLDSSTELPASGLIMAMDSLTVDVNISHTYRGDVVLDLRSPSGTLINLKGADVADSAADVIGSFPSTLTPTESLNSFLDESIAGSWTLFVADAFDGDVGVFNSWAINIDYAAASAVSGSGSPLEVNGLTNGTTYSCDIYASNASGNGPAAVVSVTPNTASVPAKPTITSIEPDDAGLLVRFAPGSDGGSPITGYTVTCDGFSQAGDSSPITLLGLPNDQEYSCTVVTMNAIGSSAASSPASGTPQEMIPSGLPVWLLYKAIENQGS